LRWLAGASVTKAKVESGRRDPPYNERREG
jgi:hypothetical protein